MSEQKNFKVGDKVRITGHGGHISDRLVTFFGVLETVSSVTPDGFVGVRGDTVFVHSRLCDPVLEDERRGAPRPPEQRGELVHITIAARWEPGSNSFFLGEGHEDVWIDRGDGLHYRKPLVVKVRQIERRNPGCKACLDRGCKKPGCTARGREARKS